MKETDVRQEVYRLFRSLGYWPITQTDLNAPFPVALVNKLLGKLIRLTRPYPHILKVVLALKKVLDKATPRPPIGRPDILVMNPRGRSCVCEVKVLPQNSKSFAFSRISEKQRKWLTSWQEDGGIGFIALGTLVPRKRRLWLVEWTAWRQLESLISPYQQSVPLVAGKGMRRELQDNHLDLDSLLREWELIKVNGGWKLSPQSRLGGMLNAEATVHHPGEPTRSCTTASGCPG